MKIIERDILPFQEDNFFSPLRTKTDYAKLIVLSARKLLLGNEIEEVHSDSKMKLIVDKMSRLFFYKGNKYFSISFPLVTIIDDNEISEITTYSGKNIDFKNISAVIAILESEQFKFNPSLIDFYIEPFGIESSGLFLLEEIFQFEPSYVRYDHDPLHENGKLHPLYHLDLNYSQHSTFKVGLNNNISENYFENLHNTNTECLYLTD